MRNYNFYPTLFTFFTSKSLHFLVLGCIISCQSLVAQTPYVYWQLTNVNCNNNHWSWVNTLPNGNNGSNELLSYQNCSTSVITSSPSCPNCVGKGISITAAEVLASTGNNMNLTSNMAFEFLMKPNPTNGESKLLLGTQFAKIQWTIEGFSVTTLFKNAQNQDKSFQIT